MWRYIDKCKIINNSDYKNDIKDLKENWRIKKYYSSYCKFKYSTKLKNDTHENIESYNVHNPDKSRLGNLNLFMRLDLPTEPLLDAGCLGWHQTSLHNFLYYRKDWSMEYNRQQIWIICVKPKSLRHLSYNISILMITNKDIMICIETRTRIDLLHLRTYFLLNIAILEWCIQQTTNHLNKIHRENRNSYSDKVKKVLKKYYSQVNYNSIKK
jgi:hypothetical protein